MINSTNRLNNSRLIKKVISKGVGCRTALMNFKALRNKRRGVPGKVTVVVSKKVSNLAVDRNRIKRRIRNALSDYIDEINGWSVVVFPTKLAMTADFEDIKSDIEKCLKRLQNF